MTEARPLRVLDTGVLEGRLNIAIGQAIVEARRADDVPDTLRFLRFPPTALVGRHQVLSEEVDIGYCFRHGVGLARRITGGGAIYMEPGLLGWELAVDRRGVGGGTLAELTRAICEAAAQGISRLGVEARYRPRNDIEVGGRKISGTGGFFDGNTLFFQGTVLVHMDPTVMMSALVVPRAKLAKRQLDSVEQRVVTLRELRGEATPSMAEIQRALAEAFAERFGFDARWGDLTEAERVEAKTRYHEEIGTEEFLDDIEPPSVARGALVGQVTGPGGTIKAYLKLEGPAQNRVQAALFAGDFFITPPRVVFDLESRLRGVAVDDLAGVVEGFFKTAGIETLSVQPADFIAALQQALEAE